MTLIVLGHVTGSLGMFEGVPHEHNWPVASLSIGANSLLAIHFFSEPLRNPMMFFLVGYYAQKHLLSGIVAAWKSRGKRTLKVYLIWRFLYGVFLALGILATSILSVASTQVSPSLMSLFFEPNYYWFILAGFLYTLLASILRNPVALIVSGLAALLFALIVPTDWQSFSILSHLIFFALGANGKILERLPDSTVVWARILLPAALLFHVLTIGGDLEGVVYSVGGFLGVAAISGWTVFKGSADPRPKTEPNAVERHFIRTGEGTLYIFLLSPFPLSLFSGLSIWLGSILPKSDFATLTYVLVATIVCVQAPIVLGKIIRKELPSLLG